MARLVDRNRASVLIALPTFLGAVLYLIVVAAEIAGGHPIWYLEARNLSEAVALRDGAAAVRLAEQKQDVNATGEVRARLILDAAAMLTPIEAAAGARDEDIVQLLFDLGASPDAAVWNRAFCISDATRVREILRAHRPPGAVEDCAEP